jgi:hypothetical protein
VLEVGLVEVLGSALGETVVDRDDDGIEVGPDTAVE